MTEQCKLCLQRVASLEDSHFLSAGIYRILRDDNEKNPNPWLLTKETAVQTSRQMTARLLCRDCEQRFSKFAPLAAARDSGRDLRVAGIDGELSGTSAKTGVYNGPGDA